MGVKQAQEIEDAFLSTLAQTTSNSKTSPDALPSSGPREETCPELVHDGDDTEEPSSPSAGAHDVLEQNERQAQLHDWSPSSVHPVPSSMIPLSPKSTPDTPSSTSV